MHVVGNGIILCSPNTFLTAFVFTWFSFIGEEINEQSFAGDILLGIDWTPSMELHFIDLMIDHVHRGNKVDHIFNEQAWADMVGSFNENFGLKCNKNLLEDRYICLMKQYDDICNLLNHTGFTWDESQQMVTADNDFWEAYVEVPSSLSVNIVVYFLDLSK